MPELKLPDRLRDMDMIGSVSDASKSVSEAVSDRLSKVDLTKVDVRPPKLDVKVNPSKAKARAVEMIPRRSGPNPVPFLVLGLLGGVLVGIWAATSEMFGTQIRSWVDDLENQVQAWMPGMGQKARDMQSNFQNTFSTATHRAETDYNRTAGTYGSSGYGSSDLAGATGSTGLTGGEDETVGAGTTAATGSTGSSSDLGTDGSSTSDYGTSGGSY